MDFAPITAAWQHRDARARQAIRDARDSLGVGALFQAREPRHEIARHPCGQLTGYEACGLFWNLKVRGPSDPIEHMKVIGKHARIKQFRRQLGQRSGVIVDALQRGKVDDVIASLKTQFAFTSEVFESESSLIA